MSLTEPSKIWQAFYSWLCVVGFGPFGRSGSGLLIEKGWTFRPFVLVQIDPVLSDQVLIKTYLSLNYTFATLTLYMTITHIESMESCKFMYYNYLRL